MKFIECAPGVQIALSAWNPRSQNILSPKVLDLVARLHRDLNKRRIDLLACRRIYQRTWDQGKIPEYFSEDSEAVKGNWRVADIPLDLQTRRVEITGPVNDPKMVINMLSRNSEGHRADTAMLDFEDSMCPRWENVIDGFYNVVGAALGDLSWEKKDRDGKVVKRYTLNPEDMALPMVRVRGLHLEESNIRIDGKPVSAGLFDLAVCFHLTHRILQKRGMTPKYYVPKCEHFLEANWWSDLFKAVENYHEVPTGTLRATFLIETLPAALQIEEILYEIREHAAGLNVGRWDKIFSDIKVLKNHYLLVTPDRSTINMEKPHMDNYAKRLIKICHERGAFAIGGMSAFTPGKDAETRKIQTDKVLADKKNEFAIGHDGCWVSHPYFIGPALSAFPVKNQIDKQLVDFPRYPNLIMKGEGPRTMQGLCTNIRVGIAYMEGWNRGLGCVSFDNLMEDLATLEISRAQTWQWIRHHVVLESGEEVTGRSVALLFEEELAKILIDIKDQYSADQFTEVVRTWTNAMEDARELFLRAELQEFLTTQSNPDLEEIEQVKTYFNNEASL